MVETAVALVSPGQMGASIGRRLAARGVRVITPKGRSDASNKRALEAGIEVVPEQELADADFLFSIVPPSQAAATALRFGGLKGKNGSGPLYIDWNAVCPAKSEEIGRIVTEAQGSYADGSIIGYPGKPEQPGPLLVASGPEATRLSVLQDRGVRIQVMDKPVGAASALKMAYAGVTKGLVALGAAMFLAAKRSGCSEELLVEFAASQPALLNSFRFSIPDMFSKAERFAPELREIADFIGDDHRESGIYREIADFYEHLGKDVAGSRQITGILKDVLAKA